MEKESVKKFDLEAAFKALDEIEIPQTKGIKANRVDLKERFNQKSAHETLIEDYYDVSNNEDLEEAQEEREGEVAQAKLARIEKIVDLDAETAEDLLPSYVGKVIMQCPQCMTLFYKNPEDIEHSEENPDVVNINEVCQHCGNTSGYTLIGKVDSVSEEEADNYTAAEGGEENELDLDFEEPTEEVSPEGEGEGAEEMSDEEFDKINLELEEIPEEEEANESLNLSKAAPSEEETEHKSENLTLNEGWKEAGYTSEEICNKAIEDGIKEHGGREGFIEYIKTIRPVAIEQEDDERKQKEADALIELVKNYKVEESLNVSTEAQSENETENGSENLTLNEEVDKDLDKKLAEHNDYIEYLKNLINQDEESLKKAENEEIKSAIQRHLDTLNADLEAALPDALKSIPEVAVDELADSEPVIEEEPTEVQAEEEPKEEPAEEEAPVEEALTEDGAEEEKVLAAEKGKRNFNYSAMTDEKLNIYLTIAKEKDCKKVQADIEAELAKRSTKEEGNEINYVEYKHSYCHQLAPKLRGLHYLVFQKGINAGTLIGYIKKLLKDPLVRWTDKEQEFKKNLESKTDPKDIYDYVKNSIEKAKTIKVKVNENGELIEGLNEGFEGCLYEVLVESMTTKEHKVKQKLINDLKAAGLNALADRVKDQEFPLDNAIADRIPSEILANVKKELSVEESLNKSEEAPSEHETENGSENLTLNEAADPADEILAVINSWEDDGPKTTPAPVEDSANAPVTEEPITADNNEATDDIDSIMASWESLEEGLSEEKLAEFKANDFFKDLNDVDIKKIIRIYKEDTETNDDELVADDVADYVLSGTVGGFIFANIEKLTNTCICALAKKDPKFIEALKQYYPDPVNNDEELVEIVFDVKGAKLDETIDALDEIYHNLTKNVNESLTEDAEDHLDALLDSPEFKKPISDEEVMGYFEGYKGTPAERTTHLEYTDDDPTDGKAVLPDNIEKQLTEGEEESVKPGKLEMTKCFALKAADGTVSNRAYKTKEEAEEAAKKYNATVVETECPVKLLDDCKNGNCEKSLEECGEKPLKEEDEVPAEEEAPVEEPVEEEPKEELPNVDFNTEEVKEVAQEAAEEVIKEAEAEVEPEVVEEKVEEVVADAVEEKVEAEEEPDISEEPANDLEFDEDDIDELDECSLNKHIDEYLQEVYSNVKSFETTNCELKENKLFVEGKISFKSGKEKLTMFEFLPNYGEGKLFFEGYNKDFSEDKAFTLNCTITEAKELVTESFGYKYKINETLVEGLK